MTENRHWDAATTEEAEALEELENASDRAAAIIAATFVEARLREILKKKLLDEPKINETIYKPSGAFGKFGVMIDVGRLLGLYSQTAWRDLVTIKDIRNDFAHKPFATSFVNQSIQDRCNNLEIVKTNVLQLGEDSHHLAACIFIADKAKMLRSPRSRYVTACQFFSKNFFMSARYGRDLPRPTPSF